MIITFLLTVLIDLTVAVQIGVILSAFVFLKKMTDVTTFDICKLLIKEEMHDHPETKDSDIILRNDVPDDVKVFEINGPFFFGVSDLLNETWKEFVEPPKIFVLRMRKVPLIDASGIEALKKFYYKCRDSETILLISDLQPNVETHLQNAGFINLIGKKHFFSHLENALAYARKLS